MERNRLLVFKVQSWDLQDSHLPIIAEHSILIFVKSFVVAVAD